MRIIHVLIRGPSDTPYAKGTCRRIRGLSKNAYLARILRFSAGYCIHTHSCAWRGGARLSFPPGGPSLPVLLLVVHRPGVRPSITVPSSLCPGLPPPGFYVFKLELPPNFPWAPPKISCCTPSGRFETNQPICASVSATLPPYL